MGTCQYQYGPSELYQRTRPGTAPETCCGARTWPLHDNPEFVRVTEAGPDGPVHRMVSTGRLLPRRHDDPYCPAHGGTPAPEQPVVPLAELQAAYDTYMTLAAQYTPAPAGAITAAPAAPLAPALAPAGQVPADRHPVVPFIREVAS